MGITRREAMIGAGAAAAAIGTMRAFPAIAQSGPLKIGVFVSEQDAAGVDEEVGPYMNQMLNGLRLAASEINSSGGIVGRQVEFVIRNDLGSPPSAAAVTEMVEAEGCETIVAGFVQASPRLITLRSPSPVPVLMGFWTDGSYCGPTAKQTGPTIRQVIPLIRQNVDPDSEARPFSISNWTPSGRSVSEYLYGALAGAHVGDALVTTPVEGSHAGEFQGVLRWADDMEARSIWVAEPRPYSVNIVNQAVELGLADGKMFAYVDFSELQTARLVPGASIITCIPFVSTDPNPGVQDFVGRIRSMSGDGGPVTHVAFTHYNSLMALKAAMEKSGDATAAGGIAGFEGGVTIDTATGPLTVEPGGYSTMPMFVARAEGGGQLEIVARVDDVPSGATC